MTPQSELIDALAKSVADGTFIRLSLSGYRGAEDDLKSIHIRPITVKRQPKLSFTHRYKTRDIVKNYDSPDALRMIAAMIAADFRNAGLFTTAFDITLDNDRLKKSPPAETAPPSMSHDRQKNRPIAAAGKAYLHDLNITDADGNVIPAAQDKYRQINRYIEILGSLIEGLPRDRKLNVADMGSGKGYLTFALYDYLRHTLHRDAAVTGVEYRADMVALCNDVALKSGFDGLSFIKGSIADYDSAGIDVLIALHACDTATDDAIASGITAGSELIVVAPCCHKQVRREMEAAQPAEAVSFILEHGIFRERQAEMVTDALRALLLEYHGYKTKVFEFVSDSHTPKNVMIAATRNPRMKMHDPAIAKKIAQAKATFGIGQHYLEKIRGV